MGFFALRFDIGNKLNNPLGFAEHKADACIFKYVSIRIPCPTNSLGFTGNHISLSNSAMGVCFKEILRHVPEREARGFENVNCKYQRGMDLDSYVSILLECISMRYPLWGKQVHAHSLKSVINPEVVMLNNLVNMYTKCGLLENARQVFDEMLERNIVSWTILIMAYAQDGVGEEALKLFGQMQREGIKMDQLIFSSVLKACTDIGDLQSGKQIFALIIKIGFGLNVSVGNALVTLHAKCGSIEDACKVFDGMPDRNIVSWTAMLSGYAQNGLEEEAVSLFSEMLLASVKPNHFTFATVLQACAGKGCVEQAKKVHAHTIVTGFESHVTVGNALVSVYAKCGCIEDACKVFNEIPERNIVSWNSMIGGYTQHGDGENAFRLFCQMQQEGTKPDEFTLASVLSVCATLAVLEQGKFVHAYIIKSGFERNVAVVNALLTMYAKCGSIADAHRVFEKISERNVVSWTAMIAGYSQHGNGKKALEIFRKMQSVGVKPNYITFVAVLSACSNEGLVGESWHFFHCMTRDYGIKPGVEHYACMVDLLGRAGLLHEAEDFIKRMPVEPSALVWRNLLGACRIHGNVEMGKYTAARILEQEPYDVATYVMLSNIYAAAGRWDEVAEVRKLMKDRGVRKDLGQSWVEIKNKMHMFASRDRLHPQSEEIYAKLEELTEQIKKEGYVPNTHCVLHDVKEEHKEPILFHHSERLAIAFGLINTSAETPIRIVKNLRACDDCHTAIKFISQSVGREVVMRDANRFHHFKNGKCSCGDYW
jgi:pentatricopeptide repeat protein